MPHVTVPVSWGDRWGQARADADSRQVRVHVWGGSVTQGNPGNSDPRSTSWPALVFDELQSRYGDGGTGYLHLGYADTTTGTWTGEMGMASVGSRATAAASARWENLAGTRIRLWHRNTGVTGSFRWRVDEGSWRTVSPPTGFGLEPGVDWFDNTFTGLADTAHTVDVEWVSGTVVVYGIEADRAAGIVPARCATGGRAAAQFGLNRITRFDIGITDTSTTVTSTAPGVFTSAMVGKYLSSTDSGLPPDAEITAVTDAETATISAAATATGTVTADLSHHPLSWADYPRQTVQPLATHGLGMPDLLLCAWGVNDMAYTGNADSGTVNTEAFRAGASNLLKAYYSTTSQSPDYTPDLVVVGEHLADFGDPFGSGPQIAAAARDLAVGLGGAHVDFWGLGRRSHQYASDRGWMADTVHVNDTGAAAMADQVLTLITSEVV